MWPGSKTREPIIPYFVSHFKATTKSKVYLNYLGYAIDMELSEASGMNKHKVAPSTGSRRDATRPWRGALSVLVASLIMMTLSSSVVAQESWILQKQKGTNIAITPKHQLQIRMMERPNEAVWGRLDIPVKAAQLPELHKHRKTPHFPFVDVAIEVDRYYRTAQGHIHDDDLMVTVELDLRQWEGLKKGNHLIIGLPDGSQLKESLKGSLGVLRKAETRD